MLEVGGAVVQNVAVDLAQADQSLEREPQRVPEDHHRSDKHAARSPSDRSDALHAQNKGVLCQVAAVRERVLFPHLSNPRLVGANVQHVENVVSLEEDVDRARKDEPHGCEELDIRKVGLQTLGDDVGGAEEDGASTEEDGQNGSYAGFIGDPALDSRTQWVVRVGRLGKDVGGIASEVQSDVLH